MNLLSKKIVSEYRTNFTYELTGAMNNPVIHVQTYERYKMPHDINIQNENVSWSMLTFCFGEEYVAEFKKTVLAEINGMTEEIKSFVKAQRTDVRTKTYNNSRILTQINSDEVLNIMKKYPEATITTQSVESFINTNAYNPTIQLTYKNTTTEISYDSDKRFVIEYNSIMERARRYKKFESLVKKWIEAVDDNNLLATLKKQRETNTETLHEQRCAVLKENFSGGDYEVTTQKFYDSYVSGMQHRYKVNGHVIKFDYKSTEIKYFASFTVKNIAMVKQILAIVS
jgi:hypothetical protein